MRQQGFSLIEIMVGLAMGMISMIVIMQVFSTFEGEKRTATGGADAQSNGALALYMIERDARMGGWGLGTSTYATCSSAFTYCDGSAECGGSTGPLDMPFAAIKVTDGGVNPDTLIVQFFADPNVGTFRFPANTNLKKTMPQSSAELTIGSASGCVERDEDGNIGMVIIAQGGNCTLMNITQVQGQALKLQHNPGGTGYYNPPITYQNTNGWPAYSEGATVACFKAPPNKLAFQRIYAINLTTRQLQRTDNSSAAAAPIELVAPEIIDMQVQYGVAPAGGGAANQTVNDWVNATGETWANPSMANVRRIKAIRVALVARSTQYEKPVGECTTTTPAMVQSWSSWARFNTSNYPADWKCYRYKVFETVVPLRNVMWGNM